MTTATNTIMNSASRCRERPFRGSPGFKLISEATKSQILRGIATLRIDARVPLRRARHYLRHLKGRAVPTVTGQLFPS